MGALTLVVGLGIALFIVQLEVECIKSGPYWIDFEKIDKCKDQGTNEISWFTNLTKMENGLYRGGFSMKKPMKKSTKLCVEGREMTSEGYTKLHQFNCQTCTQFWSIAGDMFANIMANAGIPPEECYIPVGDYTLNDWNASRPFRMLPKLPYNQFKFDTAYYQGQERIGCNIFYIKFVRQ